MSTKIKFSTKNDWIYDIYIRSYNNVPEYPKNFCDYFWLCFIALIFLPLTCFFICIEKNIDKLCYGRDDRSTSSNFITKILSGICVYLIILLSSYSGFIAFEDHLINTNFQFLLYFPLILGIFAILLAFLFFTLVVSTCEWTLKLIKKLTKISSSSRNNNFEKNENQSNILKYLTLKFKSFKEKHCPIIEWEEE